MTLTRTWAPSSFVAFGEKNGDTKYNTIIITAITVNTIKTDIFLVTANRKLRRPV